MRQANSSSAVSLLRDPVRFARLVLGADLWKTQRAILAAVGQHSRVAVKACHASGKTYAIALAVLWWLTAHRDGIVVTTAPTWLQVEKVVWGEIRSAIVRSVGCGRLKFPLPTQTELRLGAQNYAIGLSTDDSSRFQGFHSGHVLVVLDEAPGVRAEIYEAVEGIRAGGQVHVLALGNPVIAGGPFYEAFTSDRRRWKTITIDAFDTPNLAGLSLEQLRSLPPDLPENHPLFSYAPRPYLTTRRYVYESFWKYGEDSPFWQARVRGQFPEQAEDALISLRWLEAAREPKPVPDDDRHLYAGIDVAEAGDDETVCVIRTYSGRLIASHAWHGNSRGPVTAFLMPFRDYLAGINFDRAGVGAYFANDFEQLGFRSVTGINVGEASRFPDRFRNLKAELYWGLRERFQDGQISGLTDDLAVSQLAAIRYEINSRGQVEIESKDDLRKRGVKSPDRAEAIMLAFANVEPGILEYQRHMAERATSNTIDATVKDPWWEDVERGADELMNITLGVDEEVCPRCGRRVRGVGVDDTDGKRYHPECIGNRPQMVPPPLKQPEIVLCTKCSLQIVGAFVTPNSGGRFHAKCTV